MAETRTPSTRTTIKDIASLTGFSVPTVSLVLNGKSNFRESTRKNIIEAASSLGYRANTLARAMRSGRFGSVTLLLSKHSSRSTPFTGFLLRAEEELASNGVNLIIQQFDDEQLKDREYMPRALRESMSDGFLINYFQDFPVEMQDVIEGNGIPSVWINTLHEYDCIRPDDERMGRNATERLIESGHQRILYVTPELAGGHYSKRARCQGYQAAMEENGLKPHTMIIDLQDSSQLRNLQMVLDSRSRPTAVVLPNAASAPTVIHLARMAGLAVPQDISVVTINDYLINELGYRIAMEEFSMGEMGKRAAAMLLKKIEHPSQHYDPELLASHWMPGDTFAQAPKSDVTSTSGQ